jgi:hypothetical protein
MLLLRWLGRIPMSDAPFRSRDLAVLAHARGFTLWLYRARSVRDVVRAGFFDSAAGLVASGDMVVVSAGDGGQVFQLARSAGLDQPEVVNAVPLGSALGAS